MSDFAGEVSGAIRGIKSLGDLDPKVAADTVRVFNDRDDKIALFVYNNSGTTYRLYHMEFVDVPNIGGSYWSVVLNVASPNGGNGFTFYIRRQLGKILRIYNTYVTCDGERLDLSRALEHPPVW